MRGWLEIYRKNAGKLAGLGPTGVLALFWLSAPGLAGLYLLFDLGRISGWLEGLGPWGWLFYTVVFLVCAGLGLLPTTAQAVLGGWVFGPWKGLLAAGIAFGGAAAIGFLVTHTVAGDRVRKLLESKAEARAIRDALIGRGFWQTTGMIALLRVPPQSPFAFTNLVMVGCGAPFGPFVLGTIFGLLPRTALVMGAAHAASLTGARDIQGFVTEGPGLAVAVGGILAVMVVLAIITAVSRKALARLRVDPAAIR